MPYKPSVKSFGKTNCIIDVEYEHTDYDRPSPMMFPGFSKPGDNPRQVVFRPTANNIKHINEHWSDAEWSDGAEVYLMEFIAHQKEAAENAANKRIILEDDGSYEYKTDPFNHQRQSFLLSRDCKTFAYFMEQGTGKTKVAIDNAAYSYSKGLINALVVVAPNGVHDNWVQSEIPIHMPDWVKYKCFSYSAKDTEKVRMAKFEEVMAFDGLKVFAFNVEGFTSKKAQALIERIAKSCAVFGVIDESQKIKNHSAQRTKYLTKVSKDFVQKRIMTGTNVTKGLEDLYGQFTWLDKEILGFDSFYTFKEHFCTMGGFEMKQIVGYKNVDELIKLIEAYSFRVLKKDCLDLPDKIYKRWKIDLTPMQRRLYNELRDDYYTHMQDGGSLTADLGIVRLLRLQQIMCGWYPGDEIDEMVAIKGDNPRLEAVRQHCFDSSTPVLVWCRFRQDIQNLQYHLGKDHGRDSVTTYYGDTSPEDRMNNVRAFQAGNLKVMICSRAASTGLTLTACENPIYHSNDFDLETRLQSEDRCHRIGTTNSVIYTDIEAKKTVDSRIISSLIKKKEISDMVNNDPGGLFLRELEL